MHPALNPGGVDRVEALGREVAVQPAVVLPLKVHPLLSPGHLGPLLLRDGAPPQPPPPAVAPAAAVCRQLPRREGVEVVVWSVGDSKTRPALPISVNITIIITPNTTTTASGQVPPHRVHHRPVGLDLRPAERAPGGPAAVIKLGGAGAPPVAPEAAAPRARPGRRPRRRRRRAVLVAALETPPRAGQPVLGVALVAPPRPRVRRRGRDEGRGRR